MKRMMRGWTAACWMASIVAIASALPAMAQLDMANLEKLDPAAAQKSEDGKWLWYDAQLLDIEGKGWTDVEAYYHRLPAKAKGVVRDPVWSLSTKSAGMLIRFATNAEEIGAKWTLTSDSLAMPHMPATGVSGLDLYVKDEGVWRWIGNGRPGAQSNEQTLASGIPEGTREYAVYLPLYNGTESLSIGVPAGAVLAKAPPRPAERAKPIVMYGTSILQGGCASRPGMAHSSILGRMLDCPVINLGFSGNGKMEMELEALLAEIDAAAYVLECLPNMNPGMVTERLEPFVTALREARPGVPIILVENIKYQAGAFLPKKRAAYDDKNVALRAAYARLLEKDVKDLYYIPCDDLLGNDGEATVDGTHATDLGFLRMAQVMAPVLREALGK